MHWIGWAVHLGDARHEPDDGLVQSAHADAEKEDGDAGFEGHVGQDVEQFARPPHLYSKKEEEEEELSDQDTDMPCRRIKKLRTLMAREMSCAGMSTVCRPVP